MGISLAYYAYMLPYTYLSQAKSGLSWYVSFRRAEKPYTPYRRHALFRLIIPKSRSFTNGPKREKFLGPFLVMSNYEHRRFTIMYIPLSFSQLHHHIPGRLGSLYHTVLIRSKLCSYGQHGGHVDRITTNEIPYIKRVPTYRGLGVLYVSSEVPRNVPKYVATVCTKLP
ncbi:hypothetical protein EJ05DRAFT_17117 [Pseudovirgaria hyperparasitica]|uniref:Uncharacterized protein n=1 Tax=Pseudovirgaria hyperparasitica TaxID=470096 RepID=A0A6A6WKY8_9PEZI|nr:uncharacterized protein EJ05DRAFT_17117 [Pseudovirgaria hyperparasitica]KAF2762846.1 hypothetical protein EJ05DRAFT_17117 [Pseudovirgaria hyperparasitica]